MELQKHCHCCLQRPPARDLRTPFTHLGITESYSIMMEECFAIQLIQDNDCEHGICLECVDQLRGACQFKLQVLQCQAELRERWGWQQHVKEEEAPVLVPDATCDEDEVLAKMPPVPPNKDALCEQPSLSEEPDMQPECVGDDPESDAGPAQVFQAEEPASCMSARAREQLAARCSVRLERLQVQAAGGGTHSGRQIYSCEECGSFFRSKSVLRKHIQHSHSYSETVIDPVRNNFSSVCNATFQNKVLHSNIKNNVTKLFKCSFCGYSSLHKASLREHVRVHTGDKPFHCNRCDYKSRWKSCLKTHMRTHTHRKLFECSYCDYQCRKKETLQSHLGIHSGLKPFQCSDCDYKCNRKNNLKQHQRIHSKTKPFQCSDCDYKCNHKASLLTHLSKHTSVKPFQCSDCDYKCNYKTSLLLHLSKHTGDNLKFNSECKLKQQQGTAGVKPFRCSHCDFKCSYKGSLQRHLGLHTGLVPFQCSDCDYKCKRKDNLKQHQMIHTGVKPFQCNHCDYMCSYKASLRRHQRVHTKCSVCGFKCSDTSSLRCHEKKTRCGSLPNGPAAAKQVCINI